MLWVQTQSREGQVRVGQLSRMGQVTSANCPLERVVAVRSKHDGGHSDGKLQWSSETTQNAEDVAQLPLDKKKKYT